MVEWCGGGGNGNGQRLLKLKEWSLFKGRIETYRLIQINKSRPAKSKYTRQNGNDAICIMITMIDPAL